MKSMKKLVLVAFVLLASVMTLAGCKNDSVPEPPKYTVKFDKNAEDATGEMLPQTFTQGEKKELPANAFVRPTWTFSGWSTNKEAATPEYGNKAQFSATKDTTLYAIWTDNGTVAPVTFTTQDGTKFFYDETVTVTLATTTEGATIEYKLDDGQWQDYSSPIEILSQNTITAKAKKEGLKDSEITSISYLRKLTSITITPPTRTVYSVGDEFDPTGMVVTATYDDGETREVNTWTTDFDEITSEKGVDKKVTVSYTEEEITKRAPLTVLVFPEEVKVLTNYTSPNNTDSEWTYVAFGDWPQTIKANDVTVDENNSRGMGMFTYCLGSDGNYYVKEKENAHFTGDRYKYSDGTQVGRGETSEERWFKVEPIVWRVLTEDYNSTGNALLLAEKNLDGGRIWGSGSNNYKTSNIRKWLNGNSGNKEISDYNGTPGFLQTAFSTSDQGLIALTDVDNSKESTFGRGEVQQDNPYANGNTEDKIFLLSTQEATTEGYGFADYNEYVGDGKGTKTSTRIRATTDYAKATGAVLSESGDGDWLLRSPLHLGKSYVYTIFTSGSFKHIVINELGYGVVPALSISMNGN